MRQRKIERWESTMYAKAYCYSRGGVAWMYVHHNRKTVRKTTHLRWLVENRPAAMALLDIEARNLIHPELKPKEPGRIISLGEAQLLFKGDKEEHWNRLSTNQRKHFKRAFGFYFEGFDLDHLLTYDEMLEHIVARNLAAMNGSLRDSTREKYLQYLRMFFDWCVKEELIVENPVRDDNVEFPERLEKDEVLVWEKREMEAFIKYFDTLAETSVHEEQVENAKLFSIAFRLFYLTAMRPVEMIRLRWPDITPSSIRIDGKRFRESKPKVRYFPLRVTKVKHKATRKTRIEMWLEEIRTVLKELERWKGKWGSRVFPWSNQNKFGKAFRDAKEHLVATKALILGPNDTRAVREFRHTAINVWEEELELEWLTTCDLAGHNPAQRLRYYRLRTSERRIIAKVTRDVQRARGNGIPVRDPESEAI